MSPITIALLLAALIIVISIVFLVIHIIKTVKDSKETLNHVNGIMDNFEKQTEGITSQITLITDKTNDLSKDFSDKSSKLDTLFFGLEAFKDIIKQLVQAMKLMSTNVTNFTDAELVETKSALLWGKNILTSMKK